MSKLLNLLEVADLTTDHLDVLFAMATNHFKYNHNQLLQGCLAVNLFFESSTRTLSSFEIAEKALGINTFTLPISASSVNKGESLIDTVRTFDAMKPTFIVIRHGSSGAAAMVAAHVSAIVINAGDGSHEHPSQALIDSYTIRHFKGKIAGLTIAICGDILHSRVACSNMALLQKLGANIKLIAPPTLIPAHLQGADYVYHSLSEVIEECDVVMLLRMQKERMDVGCYVPSEREYSALYGLDHEKLKAAKPDVLVMHPGPMNRGVEVSHRLADSSLAILAQVQFGVAMRKALLHYLHFCRE